MPLTLPDGQTPIDYLDLESVGRVEVIRGAASALYGNAVGRRDRSALGTAARRAVRRAGALVGRRLGSPPTTRGCSAANAGGIGYEGNIGRTQSDGYRDFAQQQSHERVRPLHALN